MSDDFGYVNARIRCRRCQLLHEGFFREALTLSFSEMVKVLGETPYGADLTGDTLADVDRAVRSHLTREILLRFCFSFALHSRSPSCRAL